MAFVRGATLLAHGGRALRHSSRPLPVQLHVHMVFLATTHTALAEVLRSAKPDDVIWCGSNSITEADYLMLKHPNVSRFIYALGDRETTNDAIGNVEEHHPGQTIWIEAASSNEWTAGRVRRRPTDR